jgi:hypothetical protein
MTTNLVVARRALVTFAALVAATAVAACGSSSSSSSSASSSGSAGTAGASTPSASRSTLAACLKKHGVTLPARRPGGGGPPGGAPGAGGPPAGGGGFAGGAGANPKFRAAFQACGGRRRAGSTSNPSFRAAVVKYVTCVRQHGYNLPNPNFTGKGSVFSAKIRSDPKFVSASKSCQSLLAGPRPAAQAGG